MIITQKGKEAKVDTQATQIANAEEKMQLAMAKLNKLQEEMQAKRDALQEEEAKQKIQIEELKASCEAKEFEELAKRWDTEISQYQIQIASLQKKMQISIDKKDACLRLAGIKQDATPTTSSKYNYCFEGSTLTASCQKKNFSTSVNFIENCQKGTDKDWYKIIGKAIEVSKLFEIGEYKGLLNGTQIVMNLRYGTKYPNASSPIICKSNAKFSSIENAKVENAKVEEAKVEEAKIN